MAENLDYCWHDVEFFTHLLANSGQFAAARTNFVRLGDIVDDVYAGKLRGDGPAALLAPGVRRHDHNVLGFGKRWALGRGQLGLVKKGVLLLAARRVGFLGRGQKAQGLEETDLLLQMSDVS